MVEAMQLNGTLDLVIVEAENLKKGELIGKMDPYCEVELRGKTFKTEHCKDGHLNPKWNETLNFRLENVNLNEQIHFMIYDKETIKDNKIGRCDITLQELADRCKSGDLCTLELQTFGLINKGKPAGVLKVKPLFNGTGWPCARDTTGTGTCPTTSTVMMPTTTPPTTTTTTIMAQKECQMDKKMQGGECTDDGRKGIIDTQPSSSADVAGVPRQEIQKVERGAVDADHPPDVPNRLQKIKKGVAPVTDSPESRNDGMIGARKPEAEIQKIEKGAVPITYEDRRG
jgi:hypothetical protein